MRHEKEIMEETLRGTLEKIAQAFQVWRTLESGSTSS